MTERTRKNTGDRSSSQLRVPNCSMDALKKTLKMRTEELLDSRRVTTEKRSQGNWRAGRHDKVGWSQHGLRQECGFSVMGRDVPLGRGWPCKGSVDADKGKREGRGEDKQHTSDRQPYQHHLEEAVSGTGFRDMKNRSCLRVSKSEASSNSLQTATLNTPWLTARHHTPQHKWLHHTTENRPPSKAN